MISSKLKCLWESKKPKLDCNILIRIKISGITHPIQSNTPSAPSVSPLLNPLQLRDICVSCPAKRHTGDNWFPAYGPHPPFYTCFITSTIGSRTHQISVLFTYSDLVCLGDIHPPILFLHVLRSVMAFAIL